MILHKLVLLITCHSYNLNSLNIYTNHRNYIFNHFISRDRASDREYYQKSKYESREQKKRDLEPFKKGKSKYSSFPKDKRDEYDVRMVCHIHYVVLKMLGLMSHVLANE